MATVKVKGLDPLLQKFRELGVDLRGEIWRKSIMEAGEVAKGMIERASPHRASQPKKRKWGPLFQNIIVYERKQKHEYFQGRIDNQMSILIGPNHNAFYGYFVEKGFMHYKAATSKIVRERVGRHVKYEHIGGQKVKAQPFIKPIFESQAQRIKDIVIEGIKKAISD
jgi:HK97 gp10 family phage protein